MMKKKAEVIPPVPPVEIDTVEAIPLKGYQEIMTEAERYGVHAVFGGSGELDAGIEQNPSELAAFLTDMQELGVRSVLEIGTGYKGGLSRFLVAYMGWEVTSVDVENYHHVFPGVHYITHTPETHNGSKPIFNESFDLVFIDAKPTYEAVKENWEYYKHFASKVIAVHDIAGLRDCEGAAQFWKEIAYTKGGTLRKGFDEIIEDGETAGGIGWQEL